VPNTIIIFFEKVLSWLKQYNWRFIAGTAIFLTLLEIVELLKKNESFTDPFHWLELLMFFAILFMVGVLIDFLIKANYGQKHSMEILNYKHNVSMELAKIDDWESFKSELVQLPGKIADVSATRLQINNPVLGSLEEAATWSADGRDIIKSFRDCQQCINQRSGANSNSIVCTLDPDDHNIKDNSSEYCFPIKFGSSLLAVIQIKPKADQGWTTEQIEIFESICPEIAFAVKANQEQEIRKEMQNAQTALAERRTVSTFIHDQLGQNLGFLHLKLDQLVENKNIIGVPSVQTELKRLREVANESYEIVRDILKTIRSETTPNITNLLQEQARSVSRRAKLELDFQSVGKPVPLSPITQQSVFFTFCEILNNVEKHARATKVDVLVAWNNSILDISVADDGEGFEPDRVEGEEHFGLQIMKERISRIKGNLMIDSAVGSGTVVSISVPYKSAMVKSA